MHRRPQRGTCTGSLRPPTPRQSGWCGRGASGSRRTRAVVELPAGAGLANVDAKLMARTRRRWLATWLDLSATPIRNVRVRSGESPIHKTAPVPARS